MYKEKNKINFYHNRHIEIVEGKSSHSFPSRSHNSFCIGIITKGIMRLNVEKQEYFLEKDDIYIIPSHTEHKISAIDAVQYEYIVLCIYNDVEKYRKNSLCKYVFKDELVRMKILNLIQKYKSNKNEIYLGKCDYEFLDNYINIDYSCKKQIKNDAILLAADFIKNNLNEAFNLYKLSNYTNISKYHLIRLFKNQMGVTPYQFYIQEKIKQIKKGLLKQQPLSDLVFNFNFSDESHLCNTFKKYIGITPMKFKESYKILIKEQV